MGVSAGGPMDLETGVFSLRGDKVRLGVRPRVWAGPYVIIPAFLALFLYLLTRHVVDRGSRGAPTGSSRVYRFSRQTPD